jgi:uncharacterized protein
MRAPTDLPRPRRRRTGTGRGRTILVVAAVVLLVLLYSLRGLAGFYTDYLWFDSLDLTSVWTGVLRAKALLALIFTGIFFLILWVNLLIADRLAPRFRPAGPEEDFIERYHEIVGRRAGVVRTAVSLLFALIAGAGVSSQWNEWILFTHRVDFGVEDPLFHTDVGFYVFQLPFLTFVASWAFAALVIVFIVTAVAHYLNGGIRVQTQFQRVTPQVKAHLSVLLGVLALVKAGGYWLQRYELTLSSRGTVDGATYTDVKAQLPVLNLLLLISVLAFVLFLVNIRRRGWVLPVVAVGLWAFVAVVAGGIYPAFIQRFRVEPAESSREGPYIARNIEATRAAMGLASDNVEVSQFEYSEDPGAVDLSANADTIRNIRLLDPNVVQDTYQQLQGVRNFYDFRDLDVDRYDIDGRTTQVVLSARELNTSGIPQQSWEGQHLAYTHGYGAAVAPANAVTSAGRPDFTLANIPVEGDPDLTQPAIYFGEGLGGYAIVDTDRAEIDFQTEEDTRTTTYEGDGGVGVASLVRRAAFALRFGDINPLISNFVQGQSRILYIRDVRDRVEAVAPFLHFDHDAYPVITEGRIVYVIDGYTTSSRYPYAQEAVVDGLVEGSGLDHSFNYVRNSVKAVVDAYNGDVTLYETPGADPIAAAYREAFPDLFEDFDAMPEDLRNHLRFPEDLFTVQTNMWGRYHITDAQDFYARTDAWSVAQDPGSNVGGVSTTTSVNTEGQVTGSREERIDPYYLLMRLPGEEQESFLILRSFVPFSENDSRRNLIAFMVAKSDPDEYGQLEVFEMSSDDPVDGPAIVNSNILSNSVISREVSLLEGAGSEIRLGNLVLVPIDQGILYVRPLYVQSTSGTAVPELRRVIISFGGQTVIDDTLQAAMAQVFGEAPETQEGGGDDEPPAEGEPTEPTGTVDEQVQALLDQAATAFAAADQALADGDLAAYQTAIEEAQALVEQAQSLLTGSPPPTTSTDTGSSSSSSSSSTTSTSSSSSTTSTTEGASTSTTASA